MEAGASRFLSFVILGLPQLLAMLGTQPIDRWRVKKVTIVAKIMPNDFSDVSATSELLRYAQGSIPEQFCGRGKQISDFRVFKSSAPTSGAAKPGIAFPPSPRGGEGDGPLRKNIPNDFADDCATSEPLCDTQDSFWEEFWTRGKQLSDLRDFR